MGLEKESVKVFDLIVSSIDSVFKPCKYDLEFDYPEHCTIGIVDLDFGDVSSSTWFEIYYDDSKQMQREFVRALKILFTPELLDHFAKGTIVNLTLRLGPDALDGVNYFDELGVPRPKKSV